jgi:hypothetical protein
MKSDLYFVKVIIPHKKNERQTLYKISSGKHFVIHQHGNWIRIYCELFDGVFLMPLSTIFQLYRGGQFY